MDKNLRKCYQCLDLPFSASIEDVETRENALIKILNAKATEKKVSCEKEISQVQTSSKTIIENIKNNGIPKEEYHRFETSNETITILIVVLGLVGLICFFSFYVLL